MDDLKVNDLCRDNIHIDGNKEVYLYLPYILLKYLTVILKMTVFSEIKLSGNLRM